MALGTEDSIVLLIRVVKPIRRLEAQESSAHGANRLLDMESQAHRRECSTGCCGTSVRLGWLELRSWSVSENWTRPGSRFSSEAIEVAWGGEYSTMLGTDLERTGATPFGMATDTGGSRSLVGTMRSLIADLPSASSLPPCSPGLALNASIHYWSAQRHHLGVQVGPRIDWAVSIWGTAHPQSRPTLARFTAFESLLSGLPHRPELNRSDAEKRGSRLTSACGPVIQPSLKQYWSSRFASLGVSSTSISTAVSPSSRSKTRACR